MKKLRTDWLASQPVFYNQKTGKISENINEVIDYGNLEFDKEGIANYLDYGYSVYGQTPVKDVKFLGPNSEISENDGLLTIKVHDDPLINLIEKESVVSKTIDLLKNKVELWEKQTCGNIIVPTSGGYDSRLLNFLIKDKSKILAFSYGLSSKQEESHEVVIAKEITKILNISWEQVNLGCYHNYINEWINLFGCSTHAHGMYQMEFYKKIMKKIGSNLPVLSGIIGDAWAGSVEIPMINNICDLDYLAYSHGIKAESSYLNFKSPSNLKEDYFRRNKTRLKNERWRVVESMRTKIMLLCYLIKVPKAYGFKPWSPFLDIEVATSMLCLPSNIRHKRKWQKDFFNKVGLLAEKNDLKMDRLNILNIRANQQCSLNKLDEELLKELFDKRYIEWINNNIHKFINRNVIKRSCDLVLANPYINGMASRLKVGTFYQTEMEAYYAYLIVKPIEEMIRKRNNYGKY